MHSNEYGFSISLWGSLFHSAAGCSNRINRLDIGRLLRLLFAIPIPPKESEVPSKYDMKQVLAKESEIDPLPKRIKYTRLKFYYQWYLMGKNQMITAIIDYCFQHKFVIII